ncbi:hypothetical protein V6N13_062648 [Hibiscus sabdariffa]|uniref:Uncharacterized protein n=2 Tax=Hibiscus sabdariffa TaxID=183260 RepID=A0ABR2BCZ0_9ROSI
MDVIGAVVSVGEGNGGIVVAAAAPVVVGSRRGRMEIEEGEFGLEYQENGSNIQKRTLTISDQRNSNEDVLLLLSSDSVQNFTDELLIPCPLTTST